jgi:Fic family protein
MTSNPLTKKAYLKEDVVPALWNAYSKTPEFKSGKDKAIYEDHLLVRNQEKEGLKAIYKTFVQGLLSYQNQKEELLKRNPTDWLKEWKDMHKKLYGHILKKSACGTWRKENVRFGSPGDEDLHNIPKAGLVNNEISRLAEHMQSYLIQDATVNDPYKVLAQFHYQFIRIHPFSDGNGRIARAITDQLAIYFGFPPAMGGFPRHDEKKRDAYHKAITASIQDKESTDLAAWIGSYIDRQINNLA